MKKVCLIAIFCISLTIKLLSQNLSINTDGSSGPELFNIGNTTNPPFRVKATGEVLGKNNGTAANPSFSFVGDENTGIYRSASDELRITTNGTDRFTVTSSGFVGIGVTAPGFILDVNDRIRLRSNGVNTAGIWFNNFDNSALSGFLGSLSTDRIGIYLNGINAWQMVLNRTTGNVGIGTNTPGTLFHLRKDGDGEVLRIERSDATPSTYNISNSGNTLIHNYTGTSINFQQGSNNRLVVSNSGATITGGLDIIHPTAGNTHLPFSGDNNNYLSAGTTIIRGNAANSYPLYAQFTSTGVTIPIGATISNGLTVNNTLTSNGVTPIVVNRNNSGNTNIEYRNTDGSIWAGMNQDNHFAIGPNQNLNTSGNISLIVTSTRRIGVATNNPGGQLELTLDQGRKPSTNTWTIVSDERLKNINGLYTKGLSEILQLNPITYFYKNVGEREFKKEVLETEAIGFSAQQVREIFPECVGTDDDGYLNFNMHAILVAYVNAFKEQQSQIEKLGKELKDKDLIIFNLVEKLDNLSNDFQQLKSELNQTVKN